MKTKLTLLTLCLSVTIFLSAQLKLSSNGNVGIQLPDSITPLSALSIGGAGQTNAKVNITGTIIGLNALSTGTSNVGNWTYGIIGTSNLFSNMHIGVTGQCYVASPLNQFRAFGVLGIAGNSSTGYNYGVFGTTYGSQNGAGIVGTTGNNRDVNVPGIYSGYFVGDVKVTGVVTAQNLTSSDKRLKKNIVQIDENKALNGVLSLNPVEYNLAQRFNKASGDSAKTSTPFYDENSQLYQKKHFGLIAQELQQVYPNLVYQDAEGYLAVNYTGLIPLLIESIKELKTEIESLKTAKANTSSPAKANASIPTSDPSETNTLTYPVLEQNIPNPFNATTSIGFYMPTTVATANIYVYDMNGVQLKSFTISERGKGTVTIQGSEFIAGMYLYALIADGKVIDTKRMILTK